MPMDVIVPESSVDAHQEAGLADALTNVLLKWTDATDDAFIRANVGVYLHALPARNVNAAGAPSRVARLDVKVPPIALSTQERRQGFVADATEVLQRAAVAGKPFEHVWINITHATDGGWGIDGRALTTEDME